MEYIPIKATDLMVNINVVLNKNLKDEEPQTIPVRLYTTHEKNVFWTSFGIIRLTTEEKKEGEIVVPLGEFSKVL